MDNLEFRQITEIDKDNVISNFNEEFIFNVEAITVAPYSRKTHIVSVKEGQENSYNEILKICNWLNFDITNKVFKGAEDYICNDYDGNNDAVNKI